MKMKIISYRMPRVSMPVIVIGGHDDDHVMDLVRDRMADHPHTWDEYKGKSDGAHSIIDMEYRELIEKRSSGSRAGIEKELTDLAAACIYALKEMTGSKK
jgi:hypothetical protein